MSSRRAAAPRRYTCWICDRGRSVSTCAISRTTRAMAPGTAISVAQISGTSWKPILRAASAGNSAVRSGVTVNSTLITSSVVRSLRLITAVTSSAVPSRIASRSSASTWIAPRIARTATCQLLPLRCSRLPASHVLRTWRASYAPYASQADGGVQVADFPRREVACRARPQVAQLDRPHRGTNQAAHRMPDLGEHPPDDVLAALMEGDLHERARPRLLEHPEPVRDRHPVLELDADGQPPSHVAGDRPGNVRQVGLGDLVARVR